MWNDDEVDEYLEPEYEPLRQSLPFIIVKGKKDKDCIQITGGKYSGISYIYGAVSFIENDEEDVTIKFEHQIIENQNSVDTTTTEFKNFMGDILIKIMRESYKN